ncbi:hypothetical protein DFJ73DRAFT_808007 [Zopfochytrium polystomum]|nr:hypothetical protein DFJ73DRAFT_808007 [Zopfochytrium polystomum]
MGPKKPGSAKKKNANGKAGAAGSSAAEQEAVEKLAKSGVEIDILQRELDHSNSLAERLKFRNYDQKSLVLKSMDRIDVTSDMTRQYKTMQAEMTVRIQSLEAQVAELKTKLSMTQKAAQDAALEYQKVIEQKDEIIEEQNIKMGYMSSEFENMLNETLSKMSRKLDAVSQRWKENDTMHLSESNSRRLADFHLSRLTSRGDQHHQQHQQQQPPQHQMQQPVGQQSRPGPHASQSGGGGR